MGAGVLRVAPLPGETTWSLLCRIATRYAMAPGDLLPGWQWANARPQGPGGATRPDAEVLLNRAGQRALVRLSRTGEDSFAGALPSWPDGPGAFAETADDDRLLARWQVASTALGPVAFGCRLCTARRTGQASPVMRYLPRWARVCGRHQRWLLDAADGHELEHLDLADCPQVWAAQRRWAGVARRAAQAGADPERVFAMARAVVCQWWEQALSWDQETVWPTRLHHVAGGDAGPRFWWWRAVARDAVTFPEVVAVARALTDPAVQEQVWDDHGGGGPPSGPTGHSAANWPRGSGGPG